MRQKEYRDDDEVVVVVVVVVVVLGGGFRFGSRRRLLLKLMIGTTTMQQRAVKVISKGGHFFSRFFSEFFFSPFSFHALFRVWKRFLFSLSRKIGKRIRDAIIQRHCAFLLVLRIDDDDDDVDQKKRRKNSAREWCLFFREVDDDDDDDDDTSRRSGFVGVGDSRRGEREKIIIIIIARIQFARVRRRRRRRRRRGINVGEDPNVHQIKNGPDEHVEVLTAENFKKFTTGSEHVLVTFYAPWDGHSKSFLKQFHELGTSHKVSSESNLKFGKVDATVEKQLAEEFEVETYPQLVLFRHGQPKEYKGSLVAESEGLRKWLRRNTHHKPAAWLEGVDDVHVFTIGRPVCIVGFFDDTGHLDNFHAAAYDFHLDFGETSSKIATEKYKTQQPGIIMFRNFAEPAHFEGNVNSLDEIKQFIATNMVPKVVDFSKKDQMERVFEGPIATNVFLFKQENEEEAGKLEEEFAQAAEKLYGKVHFISVGYDEQALYSFFAIKAKDTPTVRLYAHDLKYAYKGSLKPEEGKKDVAKTIKDHDGNDIPNPKYDEEMARQTSKVSEDLIKFVDAYEKGKLVPILKSEKPPKNAPSANEATVVVGRTFDEIVTQSNEHVMLFFYAPWCQTSKALMPLWDKLAEMYRDYDDVTIAKMDATKNEAKGIHIKSYPTIYFYKSGDKPRHEEFDEKKDLASFIRFIGERTKLDPTKPPIHDEF